jgi:DNA-binding NarL/FixJ family response regulator
MVADDLSLVEAAERLQPGLAVVDLSMARGDVSDLMGRLRKCSPELKVILLSIHEESTVAQSACDAGADGFLIKSSIATELIPAVEAVLRGGALRFLESESELIRKGNKVNWLGVLRARLDSTFRLQTGLPRDNP